MTDRRDFEEMNALAAEYASGVLDGADLDQARRREAADPAFALEVARWRGRLAPCTRKLPRLPRRRACGAASKRALGSGPAANDNSAALHKAVTKWRAATGAMTALAACLALVLVLQQRPIAAPTPQPAPAPAPPRRRWSRWSATNKRPRSWSAGIRPRGRWYSPSPASCPATPATRTNYGSSPPMARRARSA